MKRQLRRLERLLRGARVLACALRSPGHPINAQVVVTRRCNLACAYCSEFDHASAPVPTPALLRRIDRLAEFGTSIITLSGGEPLLHPDVDLVIARIRERGAMATLLTNGMLLTDERVRRLNRAGLDYLQISLDNLAPDAVSKKSLTLLDRRLVAVSALAEFPVTINSVVGASTARPEDAYEIALRARSLGFVSAVGIVHDPDGQLRPLTEGQRDAIGRILRMRPSLLLFAQSNHFQENIIRGLPNDWHCRAGGRFLYVCEDGLVHWCSQRRGWPGIPLDAYSAADLAREAERAKPCAPFCTVSCVHLVAMLDSIRERPRATLAAMFDERKAHDQGVEVPWSVRLLSWALHRPRRGERGATVARRAPRVKRDPGAGTAPSRTPDTGEGDRPCLPLTSLR